LGEPQIDAFGEDRRRLERRGGLRFEAGKRLLFWMNMTMRVGVVAIAGLLAALSASCGGDSDVFPGSGGAHDGGPAGGSSGALGEGGSSGSAGGSAGVGGGPQATSQRLDLLLVVDN